MAEGGGGPEGLSDEVLIAAFAMQHDQEDRRSSSSSVGGGYCSGGEGGGGGSVHGASGPSRFSPASSMRRHPSSVPSASTSSERCCQRAFRVAGIWRGMARRTCRRSRVTAAAAPATCLLEFPPVPTLPSNLAA